MSKVQPESLAEFAESARHQETDGEAKNLTANKHTTPIPTDNANKHSAATEILRKAVEDGKHDPSEEVDKLPDRIIESR